MAIHRTSPEKLQRAQSRLAAVLEGLTPEPDAGASGGGGETPIAPNPSGQQLANVDAMRKLLAITTFRYEGRTWQVKRLPFEIGCQLLEQDIRVRRIATFVASNTLLEEYRDAARKIARILWQIVEPADPWGRWRKRLGLMRNPFLQAGDADLGGIKDFCLTRRMASTVALGGSESSETIRLVTESS